MSTDPVFREKRRALMRQRREERMRQYRIEFDECLEAARDLLPDRIGEEHFDRVIQALWWPLRGDVPDEWWDAGELAYHYQRYLDRNGWWLESDLEPTELSDEAIDQLAAVLTSTSQKFKAMRPVEGE